MRLFESKLKNYKKLLTEELPPPDAGVPEPNAVGGVTGTPPDAGMAPDAGMPPEGGMPTPSPTSVGFAVTTQIILDALRIKQITHMEDRKYSDNKARTPDEAWKYLEIIRRNLPTSIQNKSHQDVGNGNKEDMDNLNIVDMTNLGLKALFFVPNMEEEGGTEYSSLSNITKVTTDNAMEVYNEIRNFLSTR